MDNLEKSDAIQSLLQEMENELDEESLSTAYDEIIEVIRDAIEFHENKKNYTPIEHIPVIKPIEIIGQVTRPSFTIYDEDE